MNFSPRNLTFLLWKYFVAPLPNSSNPIQHLKVESLQIRKLLLIFLNRHASFEPFNDFWQNRLEASTDAYLISYPKSGRTWLTMLIAKMLHELYPSIPERKLATLEDLRFYGSKIPHIRRTHDNYRSILEETPGEQRELRQQQYKNRKVIFLARHPLDVLVSRYYQERYRREDFAGTIREFARETNEIDKIIRFYNLWGDLLEELPQTHLVTYESLKDDARAELEDLVTFMDLDPVSAESLDRAEHYCRFEHMKQLEQENFFLTDRLQPKDPDDPNTYKTRKGKSGSHEEELDDETRRKLKTIMRDELNHFY